MSTETLLSLDKEKWKDIVKYFKLNYEHLTTEEQSAFDVLSDYWRINAYNREECLSLIEIMSNETKKHGNMRDLQKQSQKFRELCKRYYAKSNDDYTLFQKAMGGSASISSQRTIPSTQQIRPISTIEPEPNRGQQNVTTIHYDSGSYYTGETHNGKRHGKGKYVYDDGSWDDGQWVNDNLNGEGSRYNIESDRLDEGLYRNSSRIGRGRMTWGDGHRYEGEWNQSGAHGQGEYVYPNWWGGASYKGNFVDGNRSGYGTVKWKNGSSYVGNWVNGERTGEGEFYNSENERWDIGEFKDGDRVGRGVMKWKSGDRYEGTWEDTPKGLTGYGIFHYANGSKSDERGFWNKGKWEKGNFKFSKNTLEVCCALPWILLALAVIVTWVTNSFLWAIVVAIIGGILAYISMFVMSFVWVIIEGILLGILKLFRIVK